MKLVIGVGKTVVEAVQQGAEQLGVSVEQVDYCIIEEPRKGFLGLLGGKPARVEVKLLADPVQEALRFLEKVVPLMGGSKLQFNVTTEAGHYVIQMKGEGLGLVIGRHGQTLDRLQFLLNIAINRIVDDSVHFILDVDDYRARRKEALERLACQSAERAVRSGKPVKLEAMRAYERKIIHATLQEHQDVETYSEGTEPNRRVVIRRRVDH